MEYISCLLSFIFLSWMSRTWHTAFLCSAVTFWDTLSSSLLSWFLLLFLVQSLGLLKLPLPDLQNYSTNSWAPLFSSVQFSSVAQSCPTLCNPMNCSTPGLPVHHQLPEFTQTHVHRVSDAIQPSHPLSSPSPPAPNPSQHQSLFQWVNSWHELAKLLEFQL